jgi:hypothetical protein
MKPPSGGANQVNQQPSDTTDGERVQQYAELEPLEYDRSRAVGWVDSDIQNWIKQRITDSQSGVTHV